MLGLIAVIPKSMRRHHRLAMKTNQHPKSGMPQIAILTDIWVDDHLKVELLDGRMVDDRAQRSVFLLEFGYDTLVRWQD